MSQLTNETKVVWVAVYTDSDNNYVSESYECYTQEGAVSAAEEYIAQYVAENDKYLQANIMLRIIPLYK